MGRLTYLAPKATFLGKKGKITAIMSFRIIQGHRVWCQSKARIRRPTIVNILYILTHITSHLAPFPRYVGLVRKFSLWSGGCLSSTPLFGVTSKFRIVKFGFKKQNSLFYGTVLGIFQYYELTSATDRQTNKQMDGQTFS